MLETYATIRSNFKRPPGPDRSLGRDGGGGARLALTGRTHVGTPTGESHLSGGPEALISPEAMRGFAAVEAVLQESGELADLEVIAQSWFEEGPEIAQLMVGARGPQSSEKLASYLLPSGIARRLLPRTALWMREARCEADLCWPELAPQSCGY
jgi:hypothetical protein